MQAGSNRRRDDPVAAGAFQSRNDAGPQQRGFARSGRSEQRDQFGAALRAARVEPLDEAADVVVATEIDRSVLFLESEQTRKRRTAGVPFEAALGVKRDPDELARQPFQPALAIAEQIERLDVGRYLSVAGRRLDHEEDRLAERARLLELGETPFGGEPARRLDDNDGLGLLDLPVKRLLPVGPGRDAGRLVELEQCCRESLAREP